MLILIGFAAFFIGFIILAVMVVRAGSAARSAAAPQAETRPSADITDFALTLHRGPAPTAQEILLKPLTTMDPQFRPDAFLASASAAFVTSTPGVGDVHVAEKRIEAVRVDAAQQEIDIEIVGSWVEIHAGADGTNIFFTKRLTLMRPAGSASQNVQPIRESAASSDHCPHCGAAVALGSSACPYCGTQIDQSGAPWRITAVADVERPPVDDSRHISRTSTATALGVFLTSAQSGAHSSTAVAFGSDLQRALSDIRERDPNFSEARFMRWAAATYLRDLQRREPRRATLQKSSMVVIADDGQYEQIGVVFNASGPSGAHLVEAGVFSRPRSSLTPDAPTAALNALCTECGAPLAAGDTKCRYCDAPIPDDQGDWKLERVEHTAASILRVAP